MVMEGCVSGEFFSVKGNSCFCYKKVISLLSRIFVIEFLFVLIFECNE